MAFGFDRTIFGEIFLMAASLSGVGEISVDDCIGRPNVLYCEPVGVVVIGLSVMLLFRVGTRLFNDKFDVVDFVMDVFDVLETALVAGFDATVTGVTVTDDVLIILRGNVGDDVDDFIGVNSDEVGLDITG